MIPCPVLTSYTTVYQYDCHSCKCTTDCGGGGGGGLVCVGKFCESGGAAVSTTYGAGEAALVEIGGAFYTTPQASCSAYTSPPYPIPTELPACHGGGVVGLTCLTNLCTTDGVTSATEFAPGQYSALVEIGGVFLTTPRDSCGVFTSPTNYFPVSDTFPECGDVFLGGGVAAGGVTTVTYTYTTDGALIVVETTLAAGGGPFSLSASGDSNRLDGKHGVILFWLWATAAMIAGTGMLVL